MKLARELKGPALDWAVAQIDPMCEGLEWEWNVQHKTMFGMAMINEKSEVCAFLSAKLSHFGIKARMALRREGATHYCPSTDWSQGGLLIERHAIDLMTNSGEQYVEHERWYAVVPISASGSRSAMGPTPLVAAMRALAFAKLGEEIDLPEGLQ